MIYTYNCHMFIPINLVVSSFCMKTDFSYMKLQANCLEKSSRLKHSVCQGQFFMDESRWRKLDATNCLCRISFQQLSRMKAKQFVPCADIHLWLSPAPAPKHLPPLPLPPAARPPVLRSGDDMK